MPKSSGQKLKLLYIAQILEENTDESHVMSTAELIERLEGYGIHSERKSIYDDIEKLCDFGYDIIQVQSRLGGGYYMASREFELPELKLLVDAVQASRFITTRKSRELIGKLELKAGKHDAGKLQRQVYVAGRIKTENESIYYSIDNIHRAIQENKQISFSYLDWNLKKELVPREEGFRKVSPWVLIWREENYYLAAYDSKDGIIKHYRVDKMGQVTVTAEEREGVKQFEQSDVASYANRTFGMFGGEEETVSLVFPNRFIGVVLDRFGKEADIRPLEDGYFRIRTKVIVSGQFFGWLAGIGKEAQIAAPQFVKESYRQWLMDIVNNQDS
ncbi:MAG: WYL domain-containing protein [Bacteroidales bacterium]|nr:WYL domain-containing protein [Lachnoclostridium sp.]MCM1384532.1 WYL domain-containing protein [Lachnoclostridium sp.]MCM1464076.1 WYL domain-containing protein [Bacteroidales bacterium]